MQRALLDINLHRIVRQIRQQPGINRAAIADNLRIDKSTVSRIVARLIAAGLVAETPDHASVREIGGRKIQRLRLESGFGCVLGIEIQSERMQGIVADVLGSPIATWAEDLALRECRLEAVVERCLVRMLRTVPRGLRVLGVGIGMPGLIDSSRGVLLSSNPLGVQAPREVAPTLAARWGLPVLLENDARCCCWGEIADAGQEGPESFLYVLGEYRRANQSPDAPRGPAIGLGFVFNRTIHTGEQRTAGEFRSILLDPDNPSQLSLGLREQEEVAVSDAAYTRMVGELASHLGLFVNTLNLTEVVVGGSLFRRPGEMEEALRAEIARNWMYRGTVDKSLSCRVRFTRRGEQAVAYGAAAYVLETLFAVPRLVEETGERELGIDRVLAAESRRPKWARVLATIKEKPAA